MVGKAGHGEVRWGGDRRGVVTYGNTPPWGKVIKVAPGAESPGNVQDHIPVSETMGRINSQEDDLQATIKEEE